ncbi:MAG: LysM peptidoglycan-binding domain-containing protein [Acidiphilium sp.]
MSGKITNDLNKKPLPGWVTPTAIAALGLLAVVGLVLLGGKKQFAPTAPANIPAASTQSLNTAPRFDTVRVDAGGNAVIAGRGAPGATMTIEANGKPIGTTVVGQDGSFAFVTTKPLTPGSANLTLSEKTDTANGTGTITTSHRSVAINVPQTPSEGALAVLSGGANGTSKLLSGQGPQPGTLGLSSVDYNAGHAVIAGTAKPGAQISLYLGSRYLGSALTGTNGRWTLRIPSLPATPGTFTLESIKPDGTIIQSMKTAYAPTQIAGVKPGQVIIKRGQNLWEIARAQYGAGAKYTLIYKANEASISNPNLIYPGQKFALPQPTSK